MARSAVTWCKQAEIFGKLDEEEGTIDGSNKPGTVQLGVIHKAEEIIGSFL